MAKRKKKKDNCYGFATKGGLTILRCKEKDLESVISLYDEISIQEIKIWERKIQKEIDNDKNCTFAIREANDRIIGIVFLKECQDDFTCCMVDIWIPSLIDRKIFAEEVESSVKEWLEDALDYGDLGFWEIREMRLIKGRPQANALRQIRCEIVMSNELLYESQA